MSFETWLESDMLTKMIARFQGQGKVFYTDWIVFIVNFVKNQSISTESDNLRKWVVREIGELGSDKVSKIANIEGAYKVVEGAYKDVPIPYLTLLNLTTPNLTIPNGESEANLDTKTYRKFKHLSLSEQEYKKLLWKWYTKVQIDDTLDAIENYKLNTKYTSLSLTAQKRMKKEYPDTKPAKKLDMTTKFYEFNDDL